uniref:Nucleoporin NUP188 n=1 Tax=Sinocyclocheilus anshuiensis TaxID=1608454 RepID=A0A671PZM7_9TELE
MAASELCVRSSRDLWTILLGRSALREPAQIEAELDRNWERLLQGLSFYKPPSTSAADKLKADKDTPQALKDFGLRISKLLGLDEQQSVQILQCYLQEDYRGTRNTLKAVLQDERQSQALLLKIADYYYEERLCVLRCVLHLLTYFQDERHPYRAEYSNCVSKLEKDLVSNYRRQFESVSKSEAPTWETHGNLMTERQVSHWFVQCLKEQALLLEILFLYYAYFEMPPNDLSTFTRLFKEQGFGQRQTNRHLVDKSMDALVERIGYFSSLILVEGMDIDFLHKCALEDRTEQHQFYDQQEDICKMLLTFGDISHHGPVLLAWVLLRHTLRPEEVSSVIRRLGHTTLQLGVFQYLTNMLQALGNTGNNCTASTARMCIYGLLSFVITSFEEETLGSQQHLINAACEVLAAPSLAELFWESNPNMGLGVILDSTVGLFPYKTGPLLQLLTALLSDKSTAKKVYTFLDKMSFYTEAYKHKPNDVISREDGTLWRRQTPKLLYPLGVGQTNLQMPQGCFGQVCEGKQLSVGEQGFLVRWEYSYSSWTLFTCEIEMLLHVVSTADVLAHCERVKPILDLVHKIISTDWTVSDCLLPLTSRIYMLLQRLTSFINPPVNVITSCVNCLIALAARQPGKVWSSLHHTGFLPFASTPLTNMAQTISAEGMKAGNYGNLLVLIEQPRGEYSVTIAFLRLVTTLVKGQLGSTQSRGLIPCVLLVLKEMLPAYHKWRYNTYGVRERIGCLILELVHAILNLSQEGDAPSLQSLSIYSLANTEAGQAVVNIMGVGVDTINMVLTAQPSSGGSEGPGQVLIQTVKLAFSVTNNVIRLKPQSDTASPLEQALTQHGGHGNNLIAVLAKYIYHKHDPALPRLAIQLLKRLAMEFSLGEWSCLSVVLELLDSKQQGKYWCPPLLHRAALAFLHALWQDRRDSALSGVLNVSSVYIILKTLQRSMLSNIADVVCVSVLVSAPALLPPLSLMMESVLHAEQQLTDRTKAKLLSALILALQIQGLNGQSITQLPQLLLCVCEMVQDEALTLIDRTRHTIQRGDVQEDSMETDSPHIQKDQQDSVCVLALHLSKELCRADEDGEQWLQVVRKLPVLPSVLSALELSLRSKQNLYFTEAALHLLLTLARTPQGAAAVAGAGVIQSICLPLLSVYEGPANGATQAFMRKSQDAPSWMGVYRLSLSLMESLLKTLRYNFINEALDFVGVHQERILQCLNAVRTVQSLACLDEADHTVGFLLQLSNFCKEWHFHLPQLLRDVQVNLCYLCQTCTYLLHSKKMLHHYLQAKNGEGLPPGPHPQHAVQPASKEQEEAESKALQAVQCSLLKILSKTLATLQHFTPDCCQILLDQSMDLAEYRTLFVLSFTTPAFDSDVAPSFGTLMATINVALSMLGEVVGRSRWWSLRTLKSLLMFSMENCFYVLISQAVRCLKDPSVLPRDKQRLKQELSSELSTLLSTLFRFFRRGSPSSPASGLLLSVQTKPPTPGSKATPEGQEPFIQLVQAFVRHVQR